MREEDRFSLELKTRQSRNSNYTKKKTIWENTEKKNMSFVLLLFNTCIVCVWIYTYVHTPVLWYFLLRLVIACKNESTLYANSTNILHSLHNKKVGIREEDSRQCQVFEIWIKDWNIAVGHKKGKKNEIHKTQKEHWAQRIFIINIILLHYSASCSPLLGGSVDRFRHRFCLLLDTSVVSFFLYFAN